MMGNQPTFFDFAAEVGLTKHIGGVEATEALIELCHIDRGKYVLDVGSGVGVTPCYIAKRIGCRVVGVPKLREAGARDGDHPREPG
jgi:cyclopropane fatty-acyl-phospholipid synthase-like methyltransferase